MGSRHRLQQRGSGRGHPCRSVRVNPWIAIIGLLGALTLGVLATMVVENWHRLVQPVPRPTAPEGPPTDANAERSDTSAPSATAVAPTSREAATPPPTTPTASERTEPVVPPGPTRPPEAGRPGGALRMEGSTIVVRDQDTADVLAGLLFAGYAVSGRSGADRAAAWVTATATPPGADPVRFAPGVRLRGKASRVADLLGHDEDGVVWIGMQHGVDIRRGLARSPVTQPTLAGLVTWWKSTRELPSSVDASTAGLVAESVSAVAGELAPTPWVGVIDQLLAALAGAALAGTVTTVTTEAHAPPTVASETAASETVAGTGPATVTGEPRGESVSADPTPAGLPS